MSNTKMSIDGLSCVLNMPPALKSVERNGVEVAQSLPPHKPVPAFLVDEYPACPDSWERSGPGVISYFAAVVEGQGMWLDFNGCWSHLHDVAVLPSVQGVNPITGQAQEGTALEQYRECCPVHMVTFQDNRYCPECKYHWPAQNYLATTGTPWGRLWIDGFRAKDGIVRQYIFTENEVRGVAAVKLGDKRVHSIGIAFYTSKQRKPEPPTVGVVRGGSASWFTASGAMYKPSGHSLYTSSVKHTATPSVTHNVNHSDGSSNVLGICSNSTTGSDVDGVDVALNGYMSPSVYFHDGGNLKALHGLDTDIENASQRVRSGAVAKRLEVGAGARIDQPIDPDPNGLDFWNSNPAGVIYINYTTVQHVREIIEAGKRQECEEGALMGVQVGN